LVRRCGHGPFREHPICPSISVPRFLRFQHYVELREEARKSWEYVISNEIVYLPNSVEVFANSSLVPAKIYLEKAGRVQLQFRFFGQRDFYFEAIMEPVDVDKGGSLFGCMDVDKSNLKITALSRDSTMFVDDVQAMQSPERMGFVACPSVIRLKRVDLCDGLNRRDPFSLPLKPISAVSVVNFDDGKLELIGGERTAGTIRQTPNQLVERGPHVVEYERTMVSHV
jgi:hypothetical protein